MNWQAHYATSTIKAVLPFQNQLRKFKRRIAPANTPISEVSVYPGGFDQVELLKEAGVPIEGKTVLEVGTGWHPVIPLMLRVAGAGRVILTDTHRLMDRGTIETARHFLLQRSVEMAERFGMDAAKVEARLALDGDLDFAGALAALDMTYSVPFDYDTSRERVDVISSHTVLEHISPAVIAALLEDWKKVLTPEGVILHGVDHSDHRANHDRNLSRVDFLRHSELVWKILCVNPQDYTNRLRHGDYMDMLAAAKYETLIERKAINHNALEDLRAGLPLNARFAGREFEELAILWTHLVARPA